MQVRIVVGFGLGIGITFLSGCAPSVNEANVPPAAAPTPLVPEAYIAALSAPVLLTAAPAAQAPLSPTPVAAPSVGGRTVPSSAIKSNQYHPYWVVDVH
jgi:hypothetical protein